MGSHPIEESTFYQMKTYVTQVWLMVVKDWRIEWRSREIVYLMTFFSILVMVTFSFALAHPNQPMQQIAGGMLWVVIPFTGTIGLSRMFQRERDGDTFRALLLCPASRTAIYLAKLISIFLFISLTESIIVPVLLLLFELQVHDLGMFITLLLLGTLGFSAVGAIFAAALMHSRERDILLGILLFPIITPVVLAGAKGTAALLLGAQEAVSAAIWLRLLILFNLIFITLSFWVFEPLSREE
jgi:heme exporter protein B